jgi:acyl-CoA thioester hydrolase
MPRLEIPLPEKYIFSTQIPIRIGDINRAAHLSHVNLVQILEEARARFVTHLGYKDEFNISQGKGFILADLQVIFEGQSYYGQVLQIEIGVTDIQEKSFGLVYLITNSENKSRVAIARTTILTFDYQMQKVIPLPEDLRKQLT